MVFHKSFFGKGLKHYYDRKKYFFISIDIRKPPMLGSYSLQNPIYKAGSTTSFSSEDAFEKQNIFINVSDSKENENIYVTGWMLTSFYD